MTRAWGHKRSFNMIGSLSRSGQRQQKGKLLRHYWRREVIASRVTEQVAGTGFARYRLYDWPAEKPPCDQRWRQRSTDLVPDLADLWSPQTSASGRSSSDWVGLWELRLPGASLSAAGSLGKWGVRVQSCRVASNANQTLLRHQPSSAAVRQREEESEFWGQAEIKVCFLFV